MAFAILVKGPIAPFLAFVTIFGLIIIDRDWSWLKRLNFLSGLLIIGLSAFFEVGSFICYKKVFFIQVIQTDFCRSLKVVRITRSTSRFIFINYSIFVFPHLYFLVLYLELMRNSAFDAKILPNLVAELLADN